MDPNLLRTINPVPANAATLDPDIREALLREILEPDPVLDRTGAGSKRTPRRVAALAAVCTSVLVLGAGTAYAMGAFRSPRHEALTYCAVPGQPAPIDVAGPTGDPVENCRIAWRQETGEQPPPLAAFQDSSGRVVVRVAAEPAPEGSKSLGGGNTQDPELIVLDEALIDYVDGLTASCLNEQQARSKAASVIDRTGISGWPVAAASAPGDYPDGTPLCWYASADPDDHSVRVEASPADPAARARIEPIADALRPSLTECWTKQTAAKRVQRAIDDSDFPSSAKRTFVVRQVPQTGTGCATVHLNAAGTLTFTIRGGA